MAYEEPPARKGLLVVTAVIYADCRWDKVVVLQFLSGGLYQLSMRLTHGGFPAG